MALLLKTALPELAEEIRKLLVAVREHELAKQVDGLSIVDRCRCNDTFCASFYTQSKPQGSYPPGHQTIDLDAEEGMILVDVVAGSIAHVEILNRDEVRSALLSVLPD